MKRIAAFLFSLILLFVYSYRSSNFNYIVEYDDLEDYKYHFVIIGKEDSQKNWKDIYRGVEYYSNENSILLEKRINESDSEKREIEYFEMAVNARVDGIIISGYGSEEFIEISNRAFENNIPVIFINEESNQAVRASYIGVNNYQAGQMAVELIAKYGIGTKNVGVIMERKESIQNNIRYESILSAINEQDDINWITTTTSVNSKIQLYNDIRAMIRNNPDLNAIIGTSSLHGEVIGEVLVDMNRVGEILVVAYDDYPQTLRYIANDVISSSLNVDGVEIGKKAVESLVKYRDGDFVEDIYYVPLEVIDINSLENIEENAND